MGSYGREFIYSLMTSRRGFYRPHLCFLGIRHRSDFEGLHLSFYIYIYTDNHTLNVFCNGSNLTSMFRNIIGSSKLINDRCNTPSNLKAFIFLISMLLLLIIKLVQQGLLIFVVLSLLKIILIIEMVYNTAKPS